MPYLARESAPATWPQRTLSGPASLRSLPCWLAPYALVLVKFDDCPNWPAIIAYKEGKEGRRWRKAGGERDEEELFWVIFLNEYEGSWVPRSEIIPLNAASLVSQMAVKMSAFDISERRKLMGAFEEAEDRRQEGPFPVRKAETEVEEILEGSIVIAKFDIHPTWPAVFERADNSYPVHLHGE